MNVSFATSLSNITYIGLDENETIDGVLISEIIGYAFQQMDITLTGPNGDTLFFENHGKFFKSLGSSEPAVITMEIREEDQEYVPDKIN